MTAFCLPMSLEELSSFLAQTEQRECVWEFYLTEHLMLFCLWISGGNIQSKKESIVCGKVYMEEVSSCVDDQSKDSFVRGEFSLTWVTNNRLEVSITVFKESYREGIYHYAESNAIFSRTLRKSRKRERKNERALRKKKRKYSATVRARARVAERE